jgi:prepilin-type N-terminal cleavage/methylation domain-containing protein
MRNQEGFSLIEVIISLALIGIVVTGILSALATSSRATITNDVQTTAQNLAEDQIEYMRSQQYDGTNNPPQYQVLADVPASYSVSCTAVRLDPEGDGSDDDDGLQKITVTVAFNGTTATAIEAYRVK